MRCRKDFKCSDCGIEQTPANSYTQSNGRLKSYCKECTNRHSSKWGRANRAKRKRIVRNSTLKKLYGISHDVYDQMLAHQNSQCAICKCSQQQTAQGTFSVDHCHVSGVVRGLLCDRCNLAIGLLKDDPIIATAAAKYLS